MTIPFLARAKAAVSRSTGGPEDHEPGVVECRIHTDTGHEDGVSAGRGFLKITGHLGQAEYDQIIAVAQEMAEANLQAVGVLIDSGGGHLAGVDGAVKALVDLRTALADQLFTYCEGMAASCAYALLACGGRGKVLASSGAQVGSVGAIIRLEDSSRLWREGMLTTVHALTGDQELKTIGQPGVPITKEGIAFETTQIATGKQVFQQLVAAARRMPLADLVRAAGKGGLYAASNALDLGLVDGLVDKIAFLAMVNGESDQPPQEENSMAEPIAPAPQPVETPTLAPGAPAAAIASAPVPADPAPVPALAPAPLPAQIAAQVQAPPIALPVPDPASDPLALIAAQGTQIAQLTGAITQMAETFTAEQGRQAAAAIDAKIAAAKTRIEACVPRVTRSAADQAFAASEAMIRSGADPDPVIVMLEAVQAVADGSDLRGEVTYHEEGQAEATVADADLSYFASMGKDGKAVISPEVRTVALEALGAAAHLPEGSRTPVYERIFAQRGFVSRGFG